MVFELKTNPSSLTVFDWPSRFKVAFQKRHTHMDIFTQLIRVKRNARVCLVRMKLIHISIHLLWRVLVLFFVSDLV